MWVEYCRTVANRKGNLVPESTLQGLTGFRSVYGFSEEVACILKHQGNSRGLSKYTPYSDCLFVDFDDQPEEAEKLKAALLQHDLTFDVYDSGNRSFHFHIPHPLKEGKGLPYTHQVVLEKLGLDMERVDTTLYRPNSIFRLEGTLHSKTGKAKEKIFSHDGLLLDFDLKEAPMYEKDTYEQLEGRDDVILGRFLAFTEKLLWGGALVGSRYEALFNLGCCACAAKISYSSCFEIALTINDTFSEPHTSVEVERAVENGYKFLNEREY